MNKKSIFLSLLASSLSFISMGQWIDLECGDSFVDDGGVNGPYATNVEQLYSICPGDPLTETVQIDFSVFGTEGFDRLHVIDEFHALNEFTDNVVVTLEGDPSLFPVLAQNSTGCLTLLWQSDEQIYNPPVIGWEAAITCVPIPTCLRPTQFYTFGETATSASLSWVEPAPGLTYEIEYGPQGFVLGTGTVETVTGNTYTITGLQPLSTYYVYIKTICGNGSSYYQEGQRIDTDFPGFLPHICGNPFVDNGGAGPGSFYDYADEVYTICPNNAGEYVQITLDYLSLNDYDAVSVDDGITFYDGESTNDPILDFINQDDNVFPPSDFRDTITATNPSGCITVHYFFQWAQDQDGWEGMISCLGGTPNPCASTANFSVEGVGTDTISVSWESPGSATSWLVEYGSDGFEIGTGTSVVVTDTVFTANGLTDLTTYDFYVSAICGPGDTSNVQGPISATTLEIENVNCLSPGLITIDSVSVNSVTLSWGAVANATLGYAIEYGVNGFTPGTGTQVTTTNTSFIVSGLLSNTAYDFYILTVCGAGDTSNYVTDVDATTLQSDVSVNELANQQVAIYPNPVKDVLFVKALETEIVELTIYDLNGKTMPVSISKLQSGYAVKMDQLNNGVYFIEVKTNTHTSVRKVSKL